MGPDSHRQKRNDQLDYATSTNKKWLDEKQKYLLFMVLMVTDLFHRIRLVPYATFGSSKPCTWLSFRFEFKRNCYLKGCKLFFWNPCNCLRTNSILCFNSRSTRKEQTKGHEEPFIQAFFFLLVIFRPLGKRVSTNKEKEEISPSKNCLDQRVVDMKDGMIVTHTGQ